MSVQISICPVDHLIYIYMYTHINEDIIFKAKILQKVITQKKR